MFCATWILSATAQNTTEKIRQEYASVHEWISHMMPNEEGETGMPPEYYELNVIQNLPGTGPHREVVRMFYGEEEAAEDVIYPPHYLRFATAMYNFAAREFYEEYLYDEKGRVMFIYAITPDADPNMTPYAHVVRRQASAALLCQEIRRSQRLLGHRFSAKRHV